MQKLRPNELTHTAEVSAAHCCCVTDLPRAISTAGMISAQSGEAASAAARNAALAKAALIELDICNTEPRSIGGNLPGDLLDPRPLARRRELQRHIDILPT